ncbi:MAG: thioredoxin-like protein [Bacteroidetes bacterium]|nr:thioredoxin-like protein [Bacteroidota bacterium]
MKIYQIIIAFFVLVISSCQSNKDKIIINGKIIGEITETIFYTAPVNGSFSWNFRDSIKPDSLGNFQIIVDSKDLQFIGLAVPGQVSGLLLIEPGQTYSVTFDLSNEEKHFFVNDKSKALQELCKKFPEVYTIDDYALVYVDDTVASDIKTKLYKKRDEVISDFKKLYQEKKISEKVFNFIALDRQAFYDAILGKVIWIKGIRSILFQNNLFTPEIAAFWKELYRNPLLNNPDFKRTISCYSYAENYIYFKEYLNGVFSQEQWDQINKSNPITYYQNKAKEYLPSDLHELYFANHLFEKSFQKEYEAELVPLYNQFKKSFPESKFSPFIEPYISEIVKFNNGVQNNNNVKFIEKYQSINTLSEVAQKMGKRIIFVDVWATWCGPCKEEFDYKSDLNKVLQKYDIPIVYISMDKDSDSIKWKKMVYYYNLEGFNVRVNPELFKELIKKFDANGTYAIPWYFLMDKNGKFLIKNAKRPSEIDQLEKEILGLIKK